MASPSKICKGCGILKSINDFYVHSEMKEGYLNFCKECVKERVSNRWYKNAGVLREKERLRYQRRKESPLFKKKRNDYLRKWRTKESTRAYNITHRKLRKLKPNKCEMCGKKSKLLHAHHDDYFYPFNVKWCCPVCHRKIHNKKQERRSVYAF